MQTFAYSTSPARNSGATNRLRSCVSSIPKMNNPIILWWQKIVGMIGLEPINLSALASKTSVSTNFTTSPFNSESIGLDPNTLAGTIYLAGSPRTPSGLLSIDLAEDGGNEPQTFRFTLLSKQVSEPSDIIFYNWRRVGGIDPLAFRLQLLSRQC